MEWGAEYAKFLAQVGGSHLAATVMLPRRDVIVRQLAMAGVVDRDLPQAIAFQLDGLHPFREDDAVHSWARMDRAGNVLVGITRREVINRYSGLFAGAGIKIASFTFSAAVIHAGLRLMGAPPAHGFLAVAESDGELEAYGESDARPLFSATFDAPNERLAGRARAMAIAELRLPEDTPAAALDEVLPQPRRPLEGFDLGRRAMAYATALAGACPRLVLQVNLLPPEMRTSTSRMMFLPSMVLGVLLLLSAGSLWAYSAWEERKYLASLRAEIERLEPDARKPMAMDQEIARMRAQSAMLDQFRRRAGADLDVLKELTRILEPPTWLKSLEITRDSVRFSGEAEQAAGLLKIIDQSPLFEGAEFAAPMSRSAGGENFGIRARRESAR
jgi:Tfp pilus assembly protein PilN